MSTTTSSSSSNDATTVAGMPKLNDVNWFRWYPLVRWAFKGRELWDTVEPGTQPAGDLDSIAVINWKKKADKAMSIIGFSCESSMQNLILTKETPKEMLDTLRAKCLSTSYANRSRLRRQLYSIKATPSTEMKKHIQDISDVLDHMEAIGITLEEADKIDALLTSLPETYDSLAQAMDVLAEGAGATFSKLCTYVLEQEHRQARHVQVASEQAMYTHQPQGSRFGGGGGNGGFGGGSGQGGWQGGNGGNDGKKNSQCHYCKRKGHWERDCRKKRSDGKRGKDKAAYASDKPISMGHSWICNEGNGSANPLTFVVDSGASRHIVNDRRWFDRYEPAEARRVITTANGDEMPVLGIGSVSVCLGNGQQVSFSGTAYVPSAVTNLLSVDRMVDEGFKVSFSDEGCRIARPDQSCVIIATRREGQYTVTASEHSNIGAALTADENVSKAQAQALLDHERLCHLNVAGMRALARMGVVPGLPTEIPDLPFCEGCAAGKQAATRFPDFEHSRAPRPLHTMAFDVVGPVEPPAPAALGSARYALNGTDSNTRFRWSLPIRFKSEVAGSIITLLKSLKTAYPHWPIANLRTDNGTEFVNEELGSFLKSVGITHQRSAPYTPQSNGLAERSNRVLLESVRSMLQARKLDQRLWGAALIMATRLRNWMPTKALPAGQIPARLLLGPGARMPKLRVFGSSCWVLGQGGEKGKFAAKSAKFLFIGYAHSDTYRLWDELNERIIISRNVVFDENDRPPRLTTRTTAAPQTGTVLLDIAPPSMEARLTQQMDEARRAVQARIAAAQERAREQVDQRELVAASSTTAQASSQPTEQGEQGAREGAGNSQQAEAERRTSRRLAGEGPEVEHALLAAAVPITDRRENPKSIREAMERKDWAKWKEAIEIELGALKETGTYQVVDTPRDANILTGKWVLTIKYNADGTISKYKARWVARGYSQIEGIDFDETHAPTARMASVRMVGALAAVDDLELIQWDYTTAYLNGELHNAVYIQPPEGVDVPAGKTWKLVKALYGLRQAGREWNIVLVEQLTDMGFRQSKTDASLFVRTEPSFVIIVVYVDDLIIAASKDTDLKKLKSQLAARFKGKDLGDAHHLLGIEIKRNREKRTLTMSQGRYAREVLERFGMSNCKPARTPMETKISLTPRAEGEEQADAQLYRAIVGSLMWLAMGTRVDYGFPVGFLGRFVSDPSVKHLTAAKRVLRDLKGTLDAELTFDGTNGLRIAAFVDADWAGDKADRKSTSGFAIMMAGRAVTWGAKKQTAVALSTTEAEYVAAGLAGREAIALTALLRDVGKHVDGIEIFCDNQAAISVSKNPVLHSRTKHIDIAHHWLKDAVNAKQLAFTYIPTDKNPADLLTKALPQAKVEGHRRRLGVVVVGGGDGIEDDEVDG